MNNFFDAKLMNMDNFYTFAHKSFKYGERFRIGRFCIIEKDCEVGDNVELMDYVKLMPGTKIGSNTKLDDYVNTSGYCRIGNNVRIKRCSMISQAIEIEDGVTIMSHVTFVRVRRPYSDNTEKTVTVKKGANIGSHSCVMAGVTVGEGAVVGMGAVVVKDCDPYGIYVGNPAKKIGEIHHV